eukprot:376441_1
MAQVHQHAQEKEKSIADAPSVVHAEVQQSTAPTPLFDTISSSSPVLGATPTTTASGTATIVHIEVLQRHQLDTRAALLAEEQCEFVELAASISSGALQCLFERQSELRVAS